MTRSSTRYAQVAEPEPWPATSAANPVLEPRCGQVWHDGDSDRVVLICDLWHPDLDLQRTIEPLLNESQLTAMRAAMAQQHIKLAERTYSTGASVSRVGGD